MGKARTLDAISPEGSVAMTSSTESVSSLVVGPSKLSGSFVVSFNPLFSLSLGYVGLGEYQDNQG
jgi:hypothetical protein